MEGTDGHRERFILSLKPHLYTYILYYTCIVREIKRLAFANLFVFLFA